jgi:CRP/FNR family transcriptional regulator
MDLKRDLDKSCRIDMQKTQVFEDQLSPEAQREFRSIRVPVTYGSGGVIFSERDESRGLFVVLEGEVRTYITSTDGRRLGLTIARRGDVLGLAAAAFGRAYDVTAQALYPAKLGFIGLADFTRFLARHSDVYPVITDELGRNLKRVCDLLRTVALLSTAPKKLAWLLLDWSEMDQGPGAGKLRFALKHEDIGEFIGATRETVTRTLRSFKVQNLIEFKGSRLTIPNRAALESVAYS